MKSPWTPAACLAVLALCISTITPSALGQAAAPDVRAALTALKEAPAQEQLGKRTAIVQLGDAAVDSLIGVLEDSAERQDGVFVGHCVLALGEIKAERATDALLPLLQVGDLPLAYAASQALGMIWAGKGGTAAETRNVNAALLGLLCSNLPDAALYGPALALIKVNAMPVERPESLDAAQLRKVVDAWMVANPGALPAFDQRPWQLNLRTLLTSADVAARQQALQALRQQRALGAVDAILDALAGPPAEQVVRELGGLLGELTGVSFPPEGMESGSDLQEQILAWRGRWFDAARRQTDPRYAKYAWDQLELALVQYNETPSEQGAERIKYFRALLLYLASGPEDVPPGASPMARDLLVTPLEMKKRAADAVAALESKERPLSAFEKMTQLRIIHEQVSTRGGRDVGMVFLTRLAKAAWDEQDMNVAQQVGNILARVSGVPCALERREIEKRRASLTEWADTVRKLGVPLEFPAPQ
jgi:hypothetical protein